MHSRYCPKIFLVTSLGWTNLQQPLQRRSHHRHHLKWPCSCWIYTTIQLCCRWNKHYGVSAQWEAAVSPPCWSSCGCNSPKVPFQITFSPSRLRTSFCSASNHALLGQISGPSCDKDATRYGKNSAPLIKTDATCAPVTSRSQRIGIVSFYNQVIHHSWYSVRPYDHV